ncbi:type IV pilus assembly protein PilM [Agrococcus sp. SL85]|uniref:type IV pilus assembly protein PilM n=1 Tax=Agrococcus sp. SL85 TaxID=2995141 RepID=UPI00226D04D6|nr:type IV pilus assembly protein PilM [Agrococcus sp. SL85]WAC66367.1 type IV pilus assembly protein PilM [Agrococcus sp. SL85]
MANSIVGLDIGAGGIRAVEVVPGKRGVKLVRADAIELPSGAVERGEVVEPQVVTGALKALWKRGRFRSRQVILGIGNDRVLARELTVAHAPLPLIREALPFQVQDMLPMPVSEAILDFYPVQEAEHGQVQGLLVAAVKEGVLATVDAVRRAKLEPVSVDFIPFALSRALVPPTPETTAVVDVGAHTTSVVIVAGGVPRFVRIIPAGGDAVTHTLHARFGLERANAEATKRDLGLGEETVRRPLVAGGEAAQRALGLAPAAEPDGGVVEGADPHRVQLIEAIREETGELVTGVRNTLGYFAGLRPDLPVQRVLLTGAGTALRGFPAALREVLRVPIEWADPYTALSPKDRERDALGGPRASVALGLAMRSAA